MSSIIEIKKIDKIYAKKILKLIVYSHKEFGWPTEFRTAFRWKARNAEIVRLHVHIVERHIQIFLI